MTNTVVTTPVNVEPPREGQRSNAQVVQAVEAWKYSDFLCHNYVLNGLVDSLYKVYCKTMTAKELWESLESKYKTEDAGTKKFVVAHFLDYKMVDSKNVTSQVQDLQVLLHDIHAKGMALSETFQVATITEKLPPSWVEFKNYLKHKRKKMSVEDLVVRLCIKEDNKLAQKNTYTPDSVKANMVEHAGSSSKSNSKAKGKGNGKNDKKSKRKAEYLAPKVGIVKQNLQGTCYNCDQPEIRKNLICHECKDKAIDKFVLYKTEVENQFGRKIKVVRSDRGGEYVSPFADLCVKHEIRHEFTTPYSPQQNGPRGCLAKVVVPTPKAQKIGPKSVDCIFIGYAKNSSVYRFIVHESKNTNIQKNTLMESRNASFFENISPCLTKETGSSSRIDDEVVQEKRQRDDNDLQDER
ncbi:zinc finger, CCHC-type containing protein [Tanacetum coccineum]